MELALCMQFSNNMYGVVVNVHPAEVFKVMHQELIMFNEGNQLKYEFGKTFHDRYVRQHHYILYYWLRATLEGLVYKFNSHQHTTTQHKSIESEKEIETDTEKEREQEIESVKERDR